MGLGTLTAPVPAKTPAQVCCEGRTWRLFLRFVCLFVFKVLWSDSSVTSVTKSPSEVTEFISKVRWFRAPLETPRLCVIPQ